MNIRQIIGVILAGTGAIKLGSAIYLSPRWIATIVWIIIGCALWLIPAKQEKKEKQEENTPGVEANQFKKTI